MDSLFLRLIFTLIGCSALSSRADLVTYSYTGTTASHDSTISAWFQFDSDAMSDGGVGFWEISQYSFLVAGSIDTFNGQYDRFMGGGIRFNTDVPGPMNLPVKNYLIMLNSETHSYVRANIYGDSDLFVGGIDATGPPIYSGHWEFVVVPEPGSLQFCCLFAGCWWAMTRRFASQSSHSKALMARRVSGGE